MPLPPTRPHFSTTTSSVPSGVPLAPDGAILDQELELRWQSVKEGLTAILHQMNNSGKPLRTIPHEWVNMYSDVAKLYTQNDALRKRRMYVYVRDFIRQLVNDQLHHLLPLAGSQLLSEYVRCWQSTLTYVRFMKRVLHHLQRFWMQENANTLKHDPVRPLDKLLMFYWREDLLSSLHSVVHVALSLIDDDRNGIPIDHAAVRGVVDNFVQLGAADVLSTDDTRFPSNSHDHFSNYSRTATSTAASHTTKAASADPTNSAAPGSPSDDVDNANNTSADHLATLHLYHQVFEEDCLVRTHAFYKEAGSRMVEGTDVGTFMRDIEARMADEEARARRLLHPDSTLRLRRAVEEELIGNHKAYLQDQACTMIGNGPEDNLKLVYSLLNRIEGGLTPLRVFFVFHVRGEGNKLVRSHVDKLSGKEDMKHNLILIEQLIRLYRKHAYLVKRCFTGSQFMMMAIDDAFRSFVNCSMGSLSLPNVLAHFIDHILRNGKGSERTCHEITKDIPQDSLDSQAVEAGSAQGADHSNTMTSPKEGSQLVSQVSEEETRSQCLAEVVRLFMYLDDKDLFFEAHRRLFAERLLSSHDQAAELEFVSKLKVQMGSTFTQRLNGMLNDVISSNETRREFEKFVHIKRQALPLLEESGAVAMNAESSIALRTDFNAHVLNALHWPALKVEELRVPPILRACQQSFTEFYMRDKESRKLTWIHALSTVHLKAQFGGTNYTFVVSTFQACILLLFNDLDKITVAEASEMLNVNIDELKRHMRPMLVGKKCRVLELERVREEAPIVVANTPPETRDGAHEADKSAGKERTGDAENQNGKGRQISADDTVQRNLTITGTGSGTAVVNPAVPAVPVPHVIGTSATGPAALSGLADSSPEESALAVPITVTVTDAVQLPGSSSAIASGSANPIVRAARSFGIPSITEAPVSQATQAVPSAAPVPALAGHTMPPTSVAVVSVPSTDIASQANDVHTNNPFAGNNAAVAVIPGDAVIPVGIAPQSPSLILAVAEATANTGEATLDSVWRSSGAGSMTGNMGGHTTSAVANVPPSSIQANVAVVAPGGEGTLGAPPVAVDTQQHEIVTAVLDQVDLAIAGRSNAVSAGNPVDTGEAAVEDAAEVGAPITANGLPIHAESASVVNNSSRLGGEEVQKAPASGGGADGGDADGNQAPTKKKPTGGADILRLNLGFKSKLHRVVVPSSIAKVASAEAAVSRKNVVVDRSTQVDATLVRIMKAKKQIGHSELFAEVIQALSSMFKPDLKLIKSRLERLIDQEYVQRDSDDARLYKYNA